MPRSLVGDQLRDQIRCVGDASVARAELVKQLPVLDAVGNV